ncbi:MAG: DUF2905 domain-containing protein [Syntrophales bacterium]|jgi:hypothetical protein|nr:DUF2905 domain-containing protein [Syntrophales bacterium]MCK9528411.1 DUF2905 domain-containing protein [Syntrophales bacterium]MDX9922434.1 DUF2905 domain-containing protein [Syntrophales bacterium]
MDLTPYGKLLITLGLVVAVIGVLSAYGGKIPWIGRLPGDILFKGRYGTVYFPLATCVVISILISLVLFFFRNR